MLQNYLQSLINNSSVFPKPHPYSTLGDVPPVMVSVPIIKSKDVEFESRFN